MPETKDAPPAEFPLGDIIYAWMYLQIDELLQGLREYLNELGLTVTQVTDEQVEDLVEEITDFLQENNTNESE